MYKHTLRSMHSQVNNKKQNDEKKKELLKRMKLDSPDIQDNSPSSDNTSENDIDYKDLYRKTRKDLQKLAKENNNLKSLLSQEKAKEKTVFQELSNIKKEKSSIIQENAQLYREIKMLEQQLDKEKSKVIRNENLLELTSKEKEHIASSFGYLKKKSDKQARLIDKQRKRIKNLQFNNHQKYIIPLQNLKNQVNNLTSERQSYIDTIEDLKKTI